QIDLLLKDVVERGEAQIPADLLGIRYFLTRHHGPVRCLHLWAALSRIRYLRPNVISHIRLGLLHDDLSPLHLQARPQVVGLGGAIPYGKTQLEYHAVLGIRISEHLPEHWACAGSQRVGIELAEDAEGRTQGAPRVSLCNPIIFQLSFSIRNRAAQADNLRARLEVQRQEVVVEQTKANVANNIRTQVANAAQSRPQVEAAHRA